MSNINPTTQPDNESTRAIKSFVLRQGRMSDAQKRAVTDGMPKHGIIYSGLIHDFGITFKNNQPTILEIGFGMGQATATIAKNNPQHNYIGVEVHQPGVGNLLKLIDEHSITNLKIISHDAVEVLNNMIENQSLTGIHIFFPDPWPKARHHKRRLIQPNFVSLLTQKLKPNGYIHCATDWENYAEQMLMVLNNTPHLINPHQGYAPRPDYRPLTKFEQRGINLGHGVWDIIAHKN